MSHENNASDESKAKFLEALKKKRTKNTLPRDANSVSNPKTGGSQTPGPPPPRFQRKSGPSGTAG